MTTARKRLTGLFFDEVVVSGTTVDWGLSNKQKKTLSANTTLTFTAPPGVGNLVLHLVGGASDYTLTLPASCYWLTTAITTIKAGKHYYLCFYFNGTNYAVSSGGADGVDG